MRIGILGTRGIPNNYGGFEQLAEFLSVGLVLRGHDVFVYQSSLHPYEEKFYNGVNLITCNDPENKVGTAGQFIYDLNCILDARSRNFDVLLQLGYTSSSVWHWLLPSKTKVVTNMDGMEWKRSKYNKLTQRFLKQAEQWAVKSSDELVADSLAIENYLISTYQRKSTYIAYGSHPFTNASQNQVQSFGVVPNQYHLLIARFEPENNIEMVLKGFMLTNKKLPLLLVGSTQNKFGKYLEATYKHPNIKYLGAVYDLEKLNHLRYFSKLYFHGHSVGGTNPSLLEAMASCALIAAHKNEFNKAILGNDAYYFSTPAQVAQLLEMEERNQLFVDSNLQKIQQQFTWDSIINKYETLFNYVANK